MEMKCVTPNYYVDRSEMGVKVVRRRSWMAVLVETPDG